MLKAGEFLLCKQDQDGSWGETPRSSITKTYHHLSGQVVHTAWALLTLNSISRVHSEVKIKTAIQKGVKFLLTAQLPNGDWPTQGITGVFNHNCMISYTNFRNIFPLWALTQVSNDKTKTKRYAKK